MMCAGLGQTSCPQDALMDSEHLANQSTTTPEQKSHDKRGVKDTSCILFLTTDCSSSVFRPPLSFCMKTARHFSSQNFFSYLKATNVLVSMMGPSYCLAGGHPA